jgi:hypothetical protein
MRATRTQKVLQNRVKPILSPGVASGVLSVQSTSCNLIITLDTCTRGGVVVIEYFALKLESYRAKNLPLQGFIKDSVLQRFHRVRHQKVDKYYEGANAQPIFST